MTDIPDNKLKNNKYLHFFSKVALLLLIVWVCDFSIGSLLQKYYFKQTSGAEYRTTVAMEATKAEIMIFGSSRANHHYHPQIIEDKLHQSCYNAGRDAATMFHHYAVLRAVLKRYSPKLIILDFQRGDLLKNDESYDKLSALLPYYSGHPEIRDIINLKGPFERVKLLSKIYPYNSDFLTIVAGNAKFNKSRKYDMEGYVPLRRQWHEPLKSESVKQPQTLDPNKIKAYTSFLDDCKKANIHIVVVTSPYFVKYLAADPSVQTARRIAAEKNVSFYDISNTPFFLNRPDLFDDTFHLNDEGAKIFTSNLLNDIAGEVKSVLAK